MCIAMLRHRGISLIELITVLAAGAVLAGLALPLCRMLLLDMRMAGAVNGLVHSIHAARTRAQAELGDTVVCRSSDGRSCAPAGNWSSGWIVFANHDGDDPPAVDPGEPVLAVQQGPLPLSITSNRRAFILRPFFLRATNGTAVFCDDRGAASARAVIVSYTGRTRTAVRSSSGKPLACPG